LLLTATCAYGAHSATVRDNAALVGATCGGDCTITPIISVGEISPAAEAHNWNLASIAAELLKPPADFSVASTSPGQVTALPAVPSAVFMVLTGFICVSVVKDRKLWIAALAGLLWAGQAGFSALPQLAWHLAARKQTQVTFSPGVTYIPELDQSDRLRSDIEGTAYIGLLRYLAGIPDTANSVQRGACKVQGIGYSVQHLHFLNAKRYTLNASRHTRYGQRTTKYEQRTTNIVAINPVFSCLTEATKRLAYIAEWHFYFSPAFIFENLPRGPPCQTWKRFFLLCNFDLHSVFANTLTKVRYI
jgi:hypothetical protein